MCQSVWHGAIGCVYGTSERTDDCTDRSSGPPTRNRPTAGSGPGDSFPVVGRSPVRTGTQLADRVRAAVRLISDASYLADCSEHRLIDISFKSTSVALMTKTDSSSSKDPPDRRTLITKRFTVAKARAKAWHR
jgi:hypothetical protein